MKPSCLEAVLYQGVWRSQEEDNARTWNALQNPALLVAITLRSPFREKNDPKLIKSCMAFGEAG